jgi:hypothetical protein
MVGVCAMAPAPLELPKRFASEEEAEEALARVEKRLEQIGLKIMHRTGPTPLDGDGFAGTYSDKDKRALAAQFLGHAYVTAYALIKHNKDAVERIADVLVEKRELFGDELVELLEGAKLKVPELDLTKEAAWPVL